MLTVTDLRSDLESGTGLILSSVPVRRSLTVTYDLNLKFNLNLKFADHHVEGSPFTIKVSGEGSNTQTERIHRNRDAVPQTEVGSKCHLAFKIPGVSAMDLTAFVTSPTGITDDAEIAETEDGAYGVSFVPKVLGIHSTFR